MSVENEAWDAVEKERGNYIDKAKLLSWIKAELINVYDPAGERADCLFYLRIAIEQGDFDIKDREDTHG